MESFLSVIIIIVLLILFYGAMLIVLDKQKQWENRQKARKMITEAHKLADRLLNETNNKGKLRETKIIASVLFVLAMLVWVNYAEASCTYSTDVLGNTHYRCDTGESGTIKTDILGTSRDSRTGVTWKTDVLGTVRASNGTTYRTDVLGNVRGTDGTVCKTDVLGKITCR
jgi:cbb3-type cytochrome oxidase subunit 3